MSNKIVLVDIDGCLNDYPNRYIGFINRTLGTNYRFKRDIENSLPAETILAFKRLYFSLRKYSMDVSCGTQDAINKLMEKYTVYILTSRSTSYKLITYEWLHKNDINYNEIFFYQDKKEFISIIGEKYVVAVIDDHIDFLEKLPYSIIKIWFRNNLPISSNNEIHSVETWKEVLEILLTEKQVVM